MRKEKRRVAVGFCDVVPEHLFVKSTQLQQGRGLAVPGSCVNEGERVVKRGFIFLLQPAAMKISL